MLPIHWTERAKKRMKILGETQRSLAEKIGLSQSMVAHFIARRNEASLKHIEAIAKALLVDANWLLGGESASIEQTHLEGTIPGSVGERLRYAREQLGLSVEVLAEQLALDVVYIQQMETNQVAIKEGEGLSAALQVSEDWLLYGKEQLSDATTLAHWVPVIEWEQVVQWKEVLQLPHKGEKIPIPDEMNPYCFALRVQGDAMMGVEYAFPPGSLIVVDADAVPEYGDYVLALHVSTGVATFKQYTKDGAQDYLKPLNPRYPLTPMNDDYRLCGVIATVLHKLK